MRTCLQKTWLVSSCCLAVAVGLLLLGNWFPNLTDQPGHAGGYKPKYRKILCIKLERYAVAAPDTHPVHCHLAILPETPHLPAVATTASRSATPRPRPLPAAPGRSAPSPRAPPTLV